jgi:predicted PhzF superfamily epimerase YddE/YHI9
MSIPITWVDAFSPAPFGGNPAGVVLTDSALPEETMQSIAFELGIAETAFLLPGDDAHTFGLRWFSPQTEIDLCGHATLAAAHALRQGGTVDGTATLTFQTRSGPLRASFDGDLIVLDFPAEPLVPSDLPASLEGQWPAGSVVHSSSTGFFRFVVVDRAALVRHYEPDLAAIAAAGHKAVLLTAAADDDAAADYVLRVFGPNVGIDEDPATGSAQCSAGPYWAAVLGRSQLVAHQLSPRGAVLHVRPAGDRVHIGGAATTVLVGQLC